MPNWLEETDVPLFISRRRLMKRRTFPRARGPWALDSGGFSEIAQYGRWTLGARDYVQEVRRYAREVGGMAWAAIQDWMCEAPMLKKTGKSVREHQRLTVDSYLTLRDLAPEVSWTPVVQGWNVDDYMRHVDQYDARGVRLDELPIVGVGSVCRRQGMGVAGQIVKAMAIACGIKVHGFGFKLTGLRAVGGLLESSDSMAWSFDARYSPRLEGCTHANCANCLTYALAWRARVMGILREHTN